MIFYADLSYGDKTISVDVTAPAITDALAILKAFCWGVDTTWNGKTPYMEITSLQMKKSRGAVYQSLDTVRLT